MGTRTRLHSQQTNKQTTTKSTSTTVVAIYHVSKKIMLALGWLLLLLSCLKDAWFLLPFFTFTINNCVCLFCCLRDGVCCLSFWLIVIRVLLVLIFVGVLLHGTFFEIQGLTVVSTQLKTRKIILLLSSHPPSTKQQ